MALLHGLLLDNLLLLREVVKMTHMAAKPMAEPFRLWHSGSHSAAHPHFGTSAVNLTHQGLRIFKSILGYFPLIPDTCHSSDALFTALEKLDCFPFPFTREGRDGIRACDFVYAN